MVKFVSQINAQAEEVYNWHQNFGADDRLTPPWVTKKFLRQEFKENQMHKFSKTLTGIELEKVQSNSQAKSITSEKIRSSQQKTFHFKNFDKLDNKTLIKETISVNFFSSILPQPFITSIIEKKLEREFNFRGQRIEKDIAQHKKFAKHERQSIAILGAKNEFAKQFKPFFTSGGHKVFSFVNRKPYPTAREIQLNSSNNKVSLNEFKNIDSVVFFPLEKTNNLNTASLNKILKTRINEINLMIRAFEHNKKLPKTFIFMSDTCVYRESFSNNTEKSPIDPSTSKIAKFYCELEKAVKQLEYRGVRVIYARCGNILSMRHGILKDTVNQHKFTLTRNTSNNRYLNWINLDDAIYATNQMLFDKRLYGPVNLCSNMTLEANDLPLLIAKKSLIPVLFAIPSFIYKLFYGTINSTRVFQNNSIYPQKLKENGFEFQFSNIDDALNWETGYVNKQEPLSFY